MQPYNPSLHAQNHHMNFNAAQYPTTPSNDNILYSHNQSPPSYYAQDQYLSAPHVQTHPSQDSVDSFTDDDAHALFPLPAHDSGRPHELLSLPVCLPQTTAGYDQPFARGYNDVLTHSGIDMMDWLRFIDALNIAMVCALV
jgi:hypothetical protein